MKKLIIAAAALAMGFVANASCVNWKVTGNADTEGYTILLFTAQPATKYETVAALKAAAVASAEITKVTGARTTYTTGLQTTINDSVTTTASFYMVLLEDDSAKTYDFNSVAMGSNVYDVGSEPTSTFSTKTATLLTGSTQGTIEQEEPTPEPTSGLLMLLGMAGLALRRKQK